MMAAMMYLWDREDGFCDPAGSTIDVEPNVVHNCPTIFQSSDWMASLVRKVMITAKLAIVLLRSVSDSSRPVWSRSWALALIHILLTVSLVCSSDTFLALDRTSSAWWREMINSKLILDGIRFEGQSPICPICSFQSHVMTRGKLKALVLKLDDLSWKSRLLLEHFWIWY
jgi:hypothetical protein